MIDDDDTRKINDHRDIVDRNQQTCEKKTCFKYFNGVGYVSIA